MTCRPGTTQPPLSLITSHRPTHTSYVRSPKPQNSSAAWRRQLNRGLIVWHLTVRVLTSIIVDEEELRASLDTSPLLRLVALAGHVTSQRFGRVMGRQHGLTSAGAAVLTVLNWGIGRGVEQGTPGRATHAELARRCFLTPATLTGVVDTLEKAGYVRRERDEADRRAVGRLRAAAG